MPQTFNPFTNELDFTFNFTGDVHPIQTFSATFHTDGLNHLNAAKVLAVPVPYGGSIVAMTVRSSTALTGDQVLDLEPHVNGTGLTPTDLDLQLNSTDGSKDSATVAFGTTNYDISSGDTVGFLATSTGTAKWSATFHATISVATTPIP
ncbi:MAG: hypothetical protein HQL52_16190 [Magnetococcales bacterium]|nr:hypothetical protein [Magnetococcales bacterium]